MEVTQPEVAEGAGPDGEELVEEVQRRHSQNKTRRRAQQKTPPASHGGREMRNEKGNRIEDSSYMYSRRKCKSSQSSLEIVNSCMQPDADLAERL